MTQKLADVIEKLPKKTFLVIGDLILDKYIKGKVNRISPEAPIQILNIESEEYRPGGAANVANNLSAFGARVFCAGVVGNDQPAKILTKILKQRGVITRFTKTSRKPTIVKTRLIAHNQQVLRVDEENIEPLFRGDKNNLLKNVVPLINKVDCIIFSDYNKGALDREVCQKIIKASQKPIIVGLKNPDYKKYKKVDGVSLNRAELLQITKLDNLEEAANKLIRELNIRFVIVTLGEKGISMFDKNGNSFYIPAVARQVYDVTGAGDTVLAIYSYCHICGLSPTDSLTIANSAGAVVVGKLGTATVTRQEIIANLLPVMPGIRKKIISQSECQQICKKLKAENKTIVFTNGCFDLLHPGHISTLQFAKSAGDILVVGLNSDTSVRKLKPGRPVLSQQDRANILASLEMVDYVVIFSEKTPLSLIKRIKPDVLVKGGDWSKEEIIGADFIEKYGGVVKVAPYIEGYSSSGLIKNIHKLCK